MSVSVVGVFTILLLGSCALASDARGQDGSAAANDAEREFMSWNSTMPPRTLDGYHTARFCFVATEVSKFEAEKAGDQASAHRFQLGADKSWIFAHRLAEQLGLIEPDHAAADSVELRKMAWDDRYRYRLDAIARCREVGLVYDEIGSATPSNDAGPDRSKTEDAINEKFIQWSSNWAVDVYLPGSAHIDNWRCGSDGCEAAGHFSFNRGGSVLTIQFTAQIPSVGENEYALRRLCYYDNTTGMQDCVD